MKATCKQLVDAYLEWLKGRISIADINGACEITTPFLDRHNDRLQIYVEQVGDGAIRLTDDGYIINDLALSGCPLDSPQRRKLLERIIQGFGVEEDDGELVVRTTLEGFPQKKHALVQAMLTVNDLFLTSKPRVASLFTEDVAHFLDQSDVRYTPRVDLVGKSSFPHKFDFVIPKSKNKPERLLRALNNPSRDQAESLLFARTDTKETRAPNSQIYAILNDTEKPVGVDVQSAFAQYDVRTVLWSQRDSAVPELAA